MSVYVVGVGLSERGWSDVFRERWMLDRSLAGLTRSVVNAVHDMGYRGAQVRIERVDPDGRVHRYDEGECPCLQCSGQGSLHV